MDIATGQVWIKKSTGARYTVEAVQPGWTPQASTIEVSGPMGIEVYAPSALRVQFDRFETQTYRVTLEAAQGGRNPHVFRVDAASTYDAVLMAYRERYGDHVTATRRDIHSRGSKIGAYSVVGAAGAITFADVEII